MPTELRLPQLGDTVAAAKLAVWLKQEGEAVAAGEPVVEVETDKTNVEIEAPASGVLRKIHVAAGTEGLEAGALLAVIADDGDGTAPAGDGAVPADDGAAPADDGAVRTDDGAAPAGAAARPGPTPVLAPGAARSDVRGPEPGPASAPAPAPGPAATPLARRMAAAAGLDLGTVRGTGRGGRIGKNDVERALAGHAATAAPAAGPPVIERVPDPPPPTPPAGSREAPLSAMRRVTAERLQAAKRDVPHFYLGADCAMDAALQLRQRVNEQDPGLELTLTDIVVRAAALALRQVAAANSAWADGAVRLYDAADIAVAVDTPQGLIAPIVRQADRKGLRAISGELKALAARARAGELTPEEYTGGTFTVSNLGMYGVDSLYAIVNPPQSCILGVGAARPRPVADGDSVAVRTVATCTLSADHRAIDGATGAALLAAFRTLIEEPGLLAL